MEDNKFFIRSRAMIIHDRRLLVFKHEENQDFYALPGGKMEKGKDESPYVCLARELEEETGIKPTGLKLLYINTWKRFNTETIEFVFAVQNTFDYWNCENFKGIFEHKWISQQDDVNLIPSTILKKFQRGFHPSFYDSFHEIEFI